MSHLFEKGELPDHYSYSQFNTYQTCPLDYFFKYIKYPEKREDKFYFVGGGAYHDAIEALYNGKRLEEALKVFDSKVLEGWGRRNRSEEKEYKALRVNIKDYHRKILPLYQSRAKTIEAHIDDFEIEGVDVPTELRLDLSLTDGTIVDHKTVGYTKPTAERNKQLLFYAYYQYRTEKVLAPKVELHRSYKLGGVDIDSYDVDLVELLKVAHEMASVYKRIKARDFYCSNHKYCQYSLYKEEKNSLYIRNFA